MLFSSNSYEIVKAYNNALMRVFTHQLLFISLGGDPEYSGHATHRGICILRTRTYAELMKVSSSEGVHKM